jgi:hypothetical protein
VGKVTWGGEVTADTIDKADRSQFKPYTGPAVPDAVYCWRIKVLKRATSSNKNPQLIVGLELVPRQSRPEEKVYAGYFVTDYITLTEAAAWRVASFTDAIGVTGADLIKRTKDTGEKDAKGSVELVSIGGWKHTKKELILAQLATDTDPKSKTGRKISGYWSPEALAPEADAKSKGRDDDDDDDDSDDEDDDDSELQFTREDLEGKKLKELKAILTGLYEEDEEDAPDLDGVKKAALIDQILAYGEDEDDDDDDEDDDEPDPEPEPEPAKGKKKAGAKADGKKTKSKPKKDDDEDNEAPF